MHGKGDKKIAGELLLLARKMCNYAMYYNVWPPQDILDYCLFLFDDLSLYIHA